MKKLILIIFSIVCFSETNNPQIQLIILANYNISQRFLKIAAYQIPPIQNFFSGSSFLILLTSI